MVAAGDVSILQERPARDIARVRGWKHDRHLIVAVQELGRSSNSAEAQNRRLTRIPSAVGLHWSGERRRESRTRQFAGQRLPRSWRDDRHGRSGRGRWSLRRENLRRLPEISRPPVNPEDRRNLARLQGDQRGSVSPRLRSSHKVRPIRGRSKVSGPPNIDNSIDTNCATSPRRAKQSRSRSHECSIPSRIAEYRDYCAINECEADFDPV